MTDEPEALERSLGPVQVTAGGIGIIIGAGIYVLLGEATAEAGGAVWISFLIAAALCAVTGLSYAELSSMYPSAAAEFDYSRRALPEWVAFLVGWVMISGLIVAAAAVSLGFGRYFREFVDVDPRVPALCLIAGLLALSAIGIKESGRVVVGLSIVQVGGLLGVIALGVPHIGDHDLLSTPGTAGLIGAAALVFFAYIGFDEVITLAEETQNPTRVIPRALLAALAISAVLYVATAIAAVSILGATDLGASERPLADVVDKAAGGNGATAVAIAALISTTNTTLLAITSASRLMYGMATQHALPRTFARVSRGSRVPMRSLVLVALIAAGFALTGKLSLVAQVTDFSVYLVFVAVNLSVIVLRWRQPDAVRPIRSPVSIGRLPLLPIAGIGSVALLLPALDASALMVGGVVCGVGLLAGLGLDSRSPLRKHRPLAK